MCLSYKYLYIYICIYSLRQKKPVSKRFVVYNNHKNGMFRTRPLGAEGMYVYY